MAKTTVLFVCTHNSARSQMAEGLLRGRLGHAYAAYSAGTHPSRVHPAAVRVMREIGIDLSEHQSEHIDRFREIPMDIVVTVCDSAREACPYMPAAICNMHHSFADPSRITASETAQLQAFRSARDAIREWIMQTFAD